MLAPPKPPADELELLIKEARARQRRRRIAGAVVLAAAAAVGLVSYSLLGGSRPKSVTSSHPRMSGLTASTRACRRGGPRLLLSKKSGPPGTVVSVIGCGCPNTVGQTDQLSWFNTRDERAERPGVGGPYRGIPLVRTSRTTAAATFVVQQSDSRGRGMLDMLCGGPNGGAGNAIGHFTVIH